MSAETRKWRCNRPSIIVPSARLGHDWCTRIATTFLLASYFLLLRTSTSTFPHSSPLQFRGRAYRSSFYRWVRDSWRDSINNACNNTGKEVHRSLLQGPIAYRRSAIITSLLRNTKVTQCYFTPTRGGGGSRRLETGFIRMDRLHGQNLEFARLGTRV